MAGALLALASDDDLVAAVRGGDDDAFRQLVDRHRDWLTARCRRHLGGDRHAAEDLAQECLVALQRTIVTKDAPLRVRPWLTVVARNRAIDESRKKRAVPIATVPDAVVFDAEVGDEDELLARAWGALNGRHRRVLELRELSGLTYEEIAASLALTSGAVEALLFRARTALRREYARAGGKVAAMAPMQEAVARASGHRGVLSGLADGGVALVDRVATGVGALAEVAGGGVSGGGATGSSAGSVASSSADSGFHLLHELQVRLLGLPGLDGVLGGSLGGGRLRAALAAAAVLLGSASAVAGTVVVTSDDSGAARPTTSGVTTPEPVVVVPEAPAPSTPSTPTPTPPEAPPATAPTAPAAPTTPTAPPAPAPPPSVPGPTVTVPTALGPDGVVPLPLPLPPVTPLVDDTVAQLDALVGQLLTSPG
jgi:RNA polymerase sigma factor (sigma-70 family)